MLKEFNPVIYPRKVWIAVDMSEKECAQFEPFNEFFDTNYAQVDKVVQKKTRDGGLLIRFSSLDAMTSEVITHESIHVACDIFEYCDCRVSTFDQEPLAYLAGWVAKCCDEFKFKAKLANKINQQ